MLFFFSVVKLNSANIIYSNYWRKCRDKMIGEWCLYTEEIKILVITCTNFPLNWTKKKMLENLTVTQYINNGKAELNPFTRQQVPFFFSCFLANCTLRDSQSQGLSILLLWYHSPVLSIAGINIMLALRLSLPAGKTQWPPAFSTFIHSFICRLVCTLWKERFL